MSIRTRVSSLALALFVAVGPASAQDSRASAEELFQLGKAAMARQEVTKACGYFQASLNADFALGTLLNLAICHEQAGKIASAWAEYRTLEDKARRANPPQTDRAQFAREHAEALRPRLSRVRIVLTPEVSKLSGQLVVKIDGSPAAPELFDVGVPVDLGRRKITVTAPKYDEWSTSVAVDDEKLKLEVTVPALKPTAVTANATAAAGDDQTSAAQRTVGYVVGGTGLVFLGTGAVFGILAIGAANDSKCEGCLNGSTDLRDAKSAYDRSNVFAWVSNVTLGAGLIGVGVGAYLVLSAATEKKGGGGAAPRSRRFDVAGTPGGGVLTMSGRF